jgi:hypothetical protein
VWALRSRPPAFKSQSFARQSFGPTSPQSPLWWQTSNSSEARQLVNECGKYSPNNHNLHNFDNHSQSNGYERTAAVMEVK